MQAVGRHTIISTSHYTAAFMRPISQTIIRAELSSIGRPSVGRLLTTTARRKGGVPNDPWAKREAWRHHPMFGKWRQISQIFPGLGLAIVAFGAYVAWDNMTAKEDHEHGHH
ncbi:hypothetical protein FRB91_002427 [Serendipita sp. 411]|nr:hypothetical protein FRC18_003155 [Serendipita sp. 400]KAG8855234.1 hypothetical protein FRB91_002427 [Serendipita sp. 411]